MVPRRGIRHPEGNEPVAQPNSLHYVRTDRYKYVRYFDPNGVEAPQFELYDLQLDATETQYLVIYDGDGLTLDPAAVTALELTETDVRAVCDHMAALLMAQETLRDSPPKSF